MTYWVRTILIMFIDGVLINLSIYISLLLRFDGKIDNPFYSSFLSLIPWYTIAAIASLYLLGLYRRIWQYASIGEVFGIVKATTISTLLVVLCIYTIPLPYLPRSVYIMSWLLTIVFIGASRLLWRLLRDLIIKDISTIAKKTLIVGAGDAGVMVARELQNNKALNLVPIGFVDDSRSKQKMSILGLTVLGNRYDIPSLVNQHEIEEIIIAMPSVSGKTLREIVDLCRTRTTAKIRIFPGGSELLSEKQKFRDIELKDLLRREPIELNLDEIASYLGNKTVLVTGAGGSIGSELCRQICAYNPSKIVLLEYSENNLFDIDKELRSTFPHLEIIPDLSDIKDRTKLQQVFSYYNPNVVFHAAAHKHVPLMEQNPAEALKNNVIGTKNLVEAADKFGVQVFILISTDKAVHPSNVMGATKRIAEMIIQDFNQRSPTRFAAVRFGNVLGSRGSVIPIFEEQIKKGGPLTVTHRDMTRYFMTIPEAVQLVIQAGSIAEGGEIFALDMGEPVKIVDLANDLIRLHGFEPDKDIKLVFTGIRPGEKLYEELFSAGEQVASTRHDRIFICRRDIDIPAGVLDSLELISRIACINPDEAEDLIKNLLPGFERTSSRQRKVL